MFHYFDHLSDIIFGHNNKFVLIELQSKNCVFLAESGLVDLIFEKVGHVELVGNNASTTSIQIYSSCP